MESSYYRLLLHARSSLRKFPELVGKIISSPLNVKLLIKRHTLTLFIALRMRPEISLKNGKPAVGCSFMTILQDADLF
jgi:hypothetical protein